MRATAPAAVPNARMVVELGSRKFSIGFPNPPSSSCVLSPLSMFSGSNVVVVVSRCCGDLVFAAQSSTTLMEMLFLRLVLLLLLLFLCTFLPGSALQTFLPLKLSDSVLVLPKANLIWKFKKDPLKLFSLPFFKNKKNGLFCFHC